VLECVAAHDAAEREDLRIEHLEDLGERVHADRDEEIGAAEPSARVEGQRQGDREGRSWHTAGERCPTRGLSQRPISAMLHRG